MSCKKWLKIDLKLNTKIFRHKEGFNNVQKGSQRAYLHHPYTTKSKWGQMGSVFTCPIFM